MVMTARNGFNEVFRKARWHVSAAERKGYEIRSMLCNAA